MAAILFRPQCVNDSFYFNDPKFRATYITSPVGATSLVWESLLLFQDVLLDLFTSSPYLHKVINATLVVWRCNIPFQKHVLNSSQEILLITFLNYPVCRMSSSLSQISYNSKMSAVLDVIAEQDFPKLDFKMNRTWPKTSVSLFRLCQPNQTIHRAPYAQHTTPGLPHTFFWQKSW